MQDSNTQLVAQSNNPTNARRWKIDVTNIRLWNRRFDNTIDTGIDWVDTLTPIVKEVAEVLNDAPLVKTITGVILDIIKIREEIKLNKKRCQEIISKVLGLSEWICKRLQEIGQYEGRVRNTLAQIETSLKLCEITLTEVFQALEKHKDRGRLARWTNRGLDDLNQADRSVDHLKDMLNLDMTFSNALHQAIHDSNRSTTAASQPPSSGHTHVLPPEPHLMVERDDQLKNAVQTLLCEERSRIAILGGGGFGKTTLALSILYHPEIKQRYKSRYFLSCEPLGNVETLLAGLGAMLCIKAAASEMLASIQSHLEKSPTLLCLDNFETPWDPPASRIAVEDLLASIADIPNLSLIITMRGTELPLKGHWLPLLKPLSPLSLKSAHQILLSICPNHIINSSTEKLLHAVEGIPLAITLIANLLHSETSDDLWNRWESGEQTGIIETSGDGREANLNASIELSVNSPRMKKVPGATTLLAALALLPDGFPVARLKELEKYLGVSNIGKLLKTLRTVALIKPDEATPFPRIQMLSPIRLFCRQFSDLSSEIRLVFENLVAYYVYLLSKAEDKIQNTTYYAQIVPEIKNIHSVFQDAIQATPDDSQDPAFRKLVEAAIYLSNWSDYTGYYAMDTIQIVCAKAVHLPILYNRCLLSRGRLHRSEGEFENAKKYFREAADLFKQKNEHFWEAQALRLLGDVLIYMREPDQAQTALEACLELYMGQVNDELEQATARFTLGDLYMSRGQYSKAEEHLTDALEAYKLSHAHLRQSDAAGKLAQLHYNLGDLVKAKEFADASLASAKQANYATGEGNALMELGNIYLLSDLLIDSRQKFEQALAIYTKTNDPLGQLYAVSELGKVYVQLDELSAGDEMLTTSAEAGLGSVNTPYVLATLGWLYICGNCLNKAVPVLDKALILFQEFKDEFGQALVLVRLGTVYLQFNQHDKAEQALRDIADLGQDVGTRDEIVRDIEMCRLWVLGDLYMAKGQLEDAKASLDAAMVKAKHRQSSYQQGHILRSMGTLYSKRGHINLAITKFQEALELHHKAQWVSEQATDFQRLGEAYEILGRSEDAERAFEQGKQLMNSVCKSRTLSLSA